MPEADGPAGRGAAVASVRVFVYYRVAEAQVAGLLPSIRAFQQALLGPGAAASDSLMRRPEAAAGLVTLMETYRLPAGLAADTALRQRLAEGPAALLPCLHGPRQVEEFVPCA